jgi:hypothetical protein
MSIIRLQRTINARQDPGHTIIATLTRVRRYSSTTDSLDWLSRVDVVIGVPTLLLLDGPNVDRPAFQELPAKQPTHVAGLRAVVCFSENAQPVLGGETPPLWPGYHLRVGRSHGAELALAFSTKGSSVSEKNGF